MSRTPLLFVFASHDRAWYNRRFHRNHISQFLADTTPAPAVVIKEQLYYHDAKSAPVTPQEKLERLVCRGQKRNKQRELLQRELSKIEATVNSLYGKTLNHGVYPGGRDVGYDRLVAGVNKAQPGRVVTRVEPQTADSAYNWWREDITGNDVDRSEWNLELLTEKLELYIPALIGFQVPRDKDVHTLAEHFRKEDPKRSIIIPRGTAHQGMTQLFSPEEYDVRIATACAALPFMDDLLIQSYFIPPSPADVKGCAQLEAHYIHYYQLRSSSGLTRLLRFIGLKDYIEQRLMTEAKAYAREQVSSSKTA